MVKLPRAEEDKTRLGRSKKAFRQECRRERGLSNNLEERVFWFPVRHKFEVVLFKSGIEDLSWLCSHRGSPTNRKDSLDFSQSIILLFKRYL